jgi:hypothetical protein
VLKNRATKTGRSLLVIGHAQELVDGLGAA